MANGDLNKTRSIDAVIERIQILAGNINEMTHIVRGAVEQVEQKASNTAVLFNSNVDHMEADFKNLSTKTNEHISPIPFSLIYVVLGFGVLALILGVLQLFVTRLENFYLLQQKPQQKSIRPHQQLLRGI